jgi:hypothetical protein
VPNGVKYQNQKVHAINVEGYVWLVIYEKRGEKVRLITLYQSRKATKKWLKEFKNDKKSDQEE